MAPRWTGGLVGVGLEVALHIKKRGPEMSGEGWEAELLSLWGLLLLPSGVRSEGLCCSFQTCLFLVSF